METPSANPRQRTEWNVRDSDVTVVFSIKSELSGGSLATVEFAKAHRKPCLHLSRSLDGTRSVPKVERFLRQYRAKVVNIAGPRESQEPEIGKYVREILDQLHGRNPIGVQRSGR